MSVWIELRCHESCEDHADERKTGEKDSRGFPKKSRCWSHDNNGCGQISGDATQKDVLATYADVTRAAIASGWKQIGKNWICPHCLMFRNK